MSHIRTDTTKVKAPNQAVLRSVVEKLAKARSGSIASAANNYSGSRGAVKSNIDLAIFTPKVTRGMAINITEGKGLGFSGDSYGYEEHYKKLQADIIGGYLDDEIETALRQAQYVVTRTPEPEGKRDTMKLVGESIDGTKVTIIRQADGKLNWEFEGFEGQTCYDVQKFVADALKARGIETKTESVTDRSDKEKWLETRLPDTLTNRNN